MDGTIIEMKYANSVWCEGLPKLYAEEKNISFEEAKKYVLGEYMKVGDHDVKWYDIKYWFSWFGINNDWRMLLNEHKNEINIYPDVIPTLKKLKSDGRYKLMICSNAGREFMDIILNVDALKKYFDMSFSSTSDFKLTKKYIEFYYKLLSVLNMKPEEILHIGDHYEFDYKIPKTVGINAYYLDRTNKTTGKNVIYSLSDVLKNLI